MSTGQTRKIVVVTGGSRGIGAATARIAARRGYMVALNYHKDAEGAQTVARQIEHEGGRAALFQADVSDPVQVEQLFAAVDRKLGRVTALVSNAGINGGPSSIFDLDPLVIRQVIDTNLLGTFHCIRLAAQRMSRSRGGDGGAIVSVSSEAARFGGNRLSAYAASKAGINAMTIGLARELAPEGIRINAVSPGIIATDQQAHLPREREAAIMASLPMRRMGTAEEVAQAILWLLSEESDYVSGVILPVSGGR